MRTRIPAEVAWLASSQRRSSWTSWKARIGRSTIILPFARFCYALWPPRSSRMRQQRVQQGYAIATPANWRLYWKRGIVVRLDVCSRRGNQMDRETPTPSERFDALMEAFAGAPDVTSPLGDPTAQRGFGASALKVKGKIFAMLTDDQLVVKLPKARVDALVAAGAGIRFD